MSETETNKIVVFFDTVGRTILGERLDTETTEQTLVVKNPAVVHILPNQQTGQLQLQILPLFFKEFLADKSEPTVWKYNRSLITEAKDLVFDFKLQAQYQQIFNPSPIITPSGSNGDVVRLFDEE
jgi:hypothetical protein